MRHLIWLAAGVALAIPLVPIVLFDPRIGVIGRRPAESVPTSAPAAAPPPPETQAPRAREGGTAPEAPPTAEPAPAETSSPRSAPPPEDPPPLRGAIRTPDVTAEREAQTRRLIAWTAHPDRVSGSAAWLDLVGLVFTEPNPALAADAEPGSAADPGDYRRLSLDLTAAPDRAAVVLADQPIAWTVRTLPPDRVGALGVEAGAAFSIRDGRPGLLGGFRSRAFGAPATAPVLDPSRYGPGTRRAFCDALRLWAGQYGLPLERLRYTLVENPTFLALEGERLRTDGISRGRVSGPRLAVFCRY
ncbi:MAG: hypothetical protein PGN34_22530 [Methylobacterium frigidaeris]